MDLSVQCHNANNAWKTTYNVQQAIKEPVEVIFAWQDNPKAASPAAGPSGKPSDFPI